MSASAEQLTTADELQAFVIRLSVENFLFREAELLDTWAIDEWLALWAPDGEISYLIPSTDKPDGQPDSELMFVQDDRFLLNQRVRSIMNGTAWAESPHSTTRRLVSNVQVSDLGNGQLSVKSSFVVHRSQAANLQLFPGHSFYTLETRDGSYQIRNKRSVLDLEELRPHGRVAFIL